MLEQTTVTVGGEAMQIESLPATRALQVLTKTIKIIGGVSAGVKDLPSSAAEAKAMGKKLAEYLSLGGMVGGLLDHLDETEHPQFIKNLVRESMPKYRNHHQVFDEWFENRFSRGTGDLFALLIHIYKWNYEDVFSWVSDFFEVAPTEEDTPPASGPETSL